MTRSLFTITATAILATTALASIPKRPDGFAGAAREAETGGKLIVVALCPQNYAQCGEYVARFREAARSILFRDIAVLAAPNLGDDELADRVAQREKLGSDPKIVVLGPDQKLLWQTVGFATAAQIGASLDRGVCAAAINGAKQIPPSFLERHRAACQQKAKGVTWHAEPEVIRP